jgi:DNA-binding NarL/FixJ family response regulator
VGGQTGDSGSSQKTRLLLVEHHPVLRKALRALVERAEDLELVGEAEDGVQAVADAVRLRPAVVLLDASLPDMSGLALARLMRQLVPAARVILLLEEDHQAYRDAARESGVAACLIKGAARQEVLTALLSS